jgi:hypothetical protein
VEAFYPAIGSRDTESMTCKELKTARRVGPETDFEEDETANWEVKIEDDEPLLAYGAVPVSKP